MKWIGANVAVFDIMGGDSIRELSVLATCRTAYMTVADAETTE